MTNDDDDDDDDDDPGEVHGQTEVLEFLSEVGTGN
jgi:hypothetical protein